MTSFEIKDLWNHYTTQDDRDLFESVNKTHTGSCLSLPDILESELEDKLQNTITRVFTKIPFSDFLILWQNHPGNNHLIFIYMMRNFLAIIEESFYDDESEILYHDPFSVLALLSKKEILYIYIENHFLNQDMEDL